jgi:flavin reductase (DIM6/NTAB) family NADH-FMN oxidoreductase RutF
MLDQEALRVAMRQWATGVTIVSSALGGFRHGMTVNSFTSITLDPPLLLVSLARATRTHTLVEGSGLFGVTILNETQREISDRFAGRRSDDEDRFEGLETFTLNSDVPFLSTGLAFFDCQVTGAYPVSDHSLFVGQVVALKTAPVLAGAMDPGPDLRPLIYFNRSYRILK